MPEKEKQRRGVPRDAQGNRVRPEQMIRGIRTMLGQGTSRGDIKRLLARKYSMRPRSFNRYLLIAEDRNREAITRSDADAKSDSVMYWVSYLQQIEMESANATRGLNACFKTIDEAYCVLDDDGATPEQQKDALDRLSQAADRLEPLRRREAKFNDLSAECRDRLDKILGVYAPVKFATTTADGADVATETKPAQTLCDASSPEQVHELARELVEMLAPLGLYIVDSGNRQMLTDGTFATVSIREAPPDPLPEQRGLPTLTQRAQNFDWENKP